MDRKKLQKETFRNYYLVVAIIAFAVYANSLSNDFVFDDESVVLGDPSITDLASIPKYFTAQEGFHKVIGKYYRPVISASYALDHAIYGFKPFGFHLTNVLIHVVNSLLFYHLLLLMFSKENVNGGPNGNFRMLILAGAVIFAVHTIHTEAVTWVSGRTDSLSFTFFAAAFICYLLYSESRKYVHIILTLAFYTLSLLSKEMSITFPAVIILYDMLIRRLSFKKILREKVYMYSAIAALSMIYLLLRWMILRDVPSRDSYFYFYGKDLLTGVLTMVQTLPLYVRLAVFPAGLLYHYNGYLPYISNFTDPAFLVSLLFIGVMIFLAVYFLKKIPFISFSILFFLVTLVPVMNIVPTMNFMAERFLYIPSAAVSVAVITITLIYSRHRTGKLITYTVLIAAITSLSFLTVKRNMEWKDNDTLFMSADGKPGTVTYVNIGNIYANSRQYDKAEVLYRKTLDLRSENILANNNLGKIFLVRGVFDSAYYYMYKAHKLDTLSPEPMYSLAQLYMNADSLDLAVHWLENIRKIIPGGYLNSNQTIEELKIRSMNKEISSDSGKTGLQLVSSLEQKSYSDYQGEKYMESLEALKKLIELNPQGRAGYYNNAGMCYLDMGNLKEAEKNFKLSIGTDKGFSTAYNNLGTVYEKKGDLKRSLEYFIKALEADTNNVSARQNMNRLRSRLK